MNTSTSKGPNWAVLFRTARIVTGLIMLAYVASHLTNMMLGLHSLQLVEAASPYLSGVWTGTFSWVLLASLIIHFLIALWSIYQRDTMRMSMHDMVQVFAGLAIIPLLAPHVFGVVATDVIFQMATYTQILQVFWIQDVVSGLRQVILLAVVWVHGCMGLLIWLRTKRSAQKFMNWIYPLAVALPVLALLGYVEGGRIVLVENHRAIYVAAGGTLPVEGAEPKKKEVRGAGKSQPVDGGKGSKTESEEQKPKGGFLENTPPPPRRPGERPLPEVPKFSDLTQEERTAAFETIAMSKTATLRVNQGAGILLILTLLARFIRLRNSGHGMVSIRYKGGQVFKAKSGPTLLDLARLNDLPHANLCQGRGRCGTCAVRILSTDIHLPPPSPLEQATLDKLGAESDVRLACQLSPTSGSIEIERLVAPDFAVKDEDLETPSVAEVV